MKEQGFKPGPWRFSPWHIEEGPSAVYAPDRSLICTTSSDADARLIAAAPALYEAAAEVLALYADEPDDNLDPAFANLRAALAKAVAL